MARSIFDEQQQEGGLRIDNCVAEFETKQMEMIVRCWRSTEAKCADDDRG
jgi:hypothetical protein